MLSAVENGFSYFDMELSTRFPYSEMVLSVLFPRYFRGLEMGFHAFEIALVPYLECRNQYQECGYSEAQFEEGKNTKYAEKQLVPV